MFIIYDLAYLFMVIFYLPAYLFRRKFHSGFARRFGILPRALSMEGPIWVHAVSVGEVMAVRGLVERLRQLYPAKRLVISTVTPTGNKIAQSIVREGDFLTYLPLDFSFVVCAVIRKINPSIFILAETEIWPNLIGILHKDKIPVITVNGRLSDSSFRGYSAVKFLVKPILNKIALFCVQTESDSRRLQSLGVSMQRIKITGNMKFDKADYLDVDKTCLESRKKLMLPAQQQLLVAGSTHQGEEQILLEVYRMLLDRFPTLRLLLAPRHPERAAQIETLIVRNGFIPQRISRLENSRGPDKDTVFILDTIGELTYYYAAADLVFVGGSLIKKGGHNILEPASLGKPILFGPYMFNFRDIAELFLENKAALAVYNRRELELNIEGLLADRDNAAGLARRAKDLFTAHEGATAKTASFIKGVIG